jgi:hypothetical protein
MEDVGLRVMADPDGFLNRHMLVYCCSHLRSGERKARFVGRHHGNWQFVCGQTDHRDKGEPYPVTLATLLDADPSLQALAALPAEWEAERRSPEEGWSIRKPWLVDA